MTINIKIGITNVRIEMVDPHKISGDIEKMFKPSLP